MWLMLEKLRARLRRRRTRLSQEELAEEARIQREAEVERRRAEARMAEQRGEVERAGGSGWGSF
jgi:hypothetical protein